MVSSTITSKAYVLGITKESILQSIYKIFYNRLAYGGTVADPNSRDKWIYPAFPLDQIDSSSAYPLIVINSPELEWDKGGLFQKNTLGRIEIEVFSIRQSELDSISDQILATIEGIAKTLKQMNIRFLNLASTDTDHTVRDKMIIHSKSLVFKFTYRFVKTY